MASVLGLFYYGYAALSLVAGISIDRIGARTVIPAGALLTGSGALLFGTGNFTAASVGRFLQGGGGVFALIGAVYIAGRNFPASQAATLIGATQMFGMAGGSAGQFLVGPMIAGGIDVEHFLDRHGPGRPGDRRCARGPASRGETREVERRLGQSIDDGIRRCIQKPAVDSVRPDRRASFHPHHDLRHDLGRSLSAGSARVRLRGSSHSVGDCPARLDHRLPAAGSAFGPHRPQEAGNYRRSLRALGVSLLDPVWSRWTSSSVCLGLIAGMASGAAMLLYTVIKEANPPQFSGTATGAINFLNFTFTALMGPVFGGICRPPRRRKPTGLEHYQITFQPLLYGVALAVLLTFALKETGPAARVPEKTMETA